MAKNTPATLEREIEALEAEIKHRAAQHRKIVEACHVLSPTSRSPEGCNWKQESSRLYIELTQLSYKMAGVIGKLRKDLKALKSL
jgi:hypothetical protein